MRGTVVSPRAPVHENGTYWGYTTRFASSIKAVIDECPYEEGYDLKIGTSERGDISIDSKNYSVPKFRRGLIVFGGVAGIEECVDADESLKLPGALSRTLFDQWCVSFSLVKFSLLMNAHSDEIVHRFFVSQGEHLLLPR